MEMSRHGHIQVRPEYSAICHCHLANTGIYPP
jgi:hypothetical protein